jgi:ABC-type maltose transport system permease subunit
MVDTLKSITKKQSFAIEAQKKVIANKDEQLAISADMIKGQDLIILDYKKIYKRDQRQIKFLKIQRNVLAIAVIVAVVVVLL